jgi:hypothetical protein
MLMTENSSSTIFGLILSFLLLLLVFISGNHFHFSKIFLVAGAVTLFLLSVLMPRSIRLIEIPWLKTADLISHLITILILGIFYYLFFTPYARLLKMFGIKFLKTNFLERQSSYWADCEKHSLSRSKLLKQYRRQF